MRDMNMMQPMQKQPGMMSRIGGLLGAGYNDFMGDLSGGAQEGLDPATQAEMRRQMLFQLGSALSSGGNLGESMMRAREGSMQQMEAMRADRARRAKVEAMKNAMGPNGFDRNAYMQALVAAGIAPEAKELGDWASLAKTDAEAGKVRMEATGKAYGLAAQLAQGGALFHGQVAQALANAGVGEADIPALLANPQKLIEIGMTPEEAQKLALERERLAETRRANMVGEGIDAGRLALSREQHGARVAAGGYGTPGGGMSLIPVGPELPSGAILD